MNGVDCRLRIRVSHLITCRRYLSKRVYVIIALGLYHSSVVLSCRPSAFVDSLNCCSYCFGFSCFSYQQHCIVNVIGASYCQSWLYVVVVSKEDYSFLDNLRYNWSLLERSALLYLNLLVLGYDCIVVVLMNCLLGMIMNALYSDACQMSLLFLPKAIHH